MKRVSLMMLAFVIGCGGSQTGAPSPESNTPSAENASSATSSTGKPSEDEAIESIREFFTDPSQAIGFLKCDVEKISAPIETPKEVLNGETWAFSVTVKGKSLVGDTDILHRNWLILIGRENGKAKVKEYFHSLERVANSPLGKEWWAKTGLPEPTTD